MDPRVGYGSHEVDAAIRDFIDPVPHNGDQKSMPESASNAYWIQRG